MLKPILCFLVTAISVQAFASGLEKSSPALIEKGKGLFKTNCAQCHGEKGDGNGPAGKLMNPKPRDFKAGGFTNGETPEAIFKTLTEGLTGKAMASFRHLSESDRSAITYYVLELKK